MKNTHPHFASHGKPRHSSPWHGGLSRAPFITLFFPWNILTVTPSPGTLNPSTSDGILSPSHTGGHVDTTERDTNKPQQDQYNPQDSSVLLPPLHGLMGGFDLESHGDPHWQSITGMLFYSNVFLRGTFGNIFTSDWICYLATCVGYSIHKDKFLLASWHKCKIYLWAQQCGKLFETGPSSILLEKSLRLQGKPNGRHFI